VTADHFSSSLQSVKKTDDSQLQQPAPDGDMPLVIQAASDIASDVDDAARRASVPKREVVVRGGIGSTPVGTSSHKQRSPEVRKPAPQRRSCPLQNIVPETLDLVGIIRRHTDVFGLVDVLENARVVRAIPMSSTPMSTDASRNTREILVLVLRDCRPIE